MYINIYTDHSDAIIHEPKQQNAMCTIHVCIDKYKMHLPEIIVHDSSQSCNLIFPDRKHNSTYAQCTWARSLIYKTFSNLIE